MEELVPWTPQTFAYLASFRSPVVLRKEKTVAKFTSRPENERHGRKLVKAVNQASRPEGSERRRAFLRDV